MKIVYVLTSGTNDLYFEQFWVSAFSARMHNPTAEIVLITDDDTQRTFSSRKGADKALSLVTSVVSVPLPTDMNAMIRSRHLKTTMRSLVAGDFFYIDSDTIICDALNEIENIPGDISMVVDHHIPLAASLKITRRWSTLAKKMGDYHMGVDGIYFNGGLMFSKDVPRSHEFFALWHTLYLNTCKKGIAEDQLSLNEANYRMGGIISKISGVWNCQVTDGMKYLPHAHIIHYFGTRLYSDKGDMPYAMANKALLQGMKDSADITDDVRRIIDDPKSPDNFCDGCIIKASSEKFDVISGEAVWPLLSLRRKHKRLYTALDNIMASVHNTIINIKR